MGNELRVSFAGDSANLYAIIRRVSDNYVWNGSAFAAWADGSIADYDVTLTARGGDLYTADFPTAIAAADYLIGYYERAGASPAITDLLLATQARYWNGAALSSSSDVTLSSYALCTLDEVKRDLGITDSTSDTALTEDINHVTGIVERVTGRKFKAREYRERYSADFTGELLLRYPVLKVRKVAYGYANAASISYSGSAVQTSASVYNDNETATSGGLVLQTVSAAGTETTSDLAFASYPSVSTLVAAVAAVSGWTATTIADGPSYDLNPDVVESPDERTVYLTYPDQVLSRYRVDHKTGILRFADSDDLVWLRAGGDARRYGRGYPYVGRADKPLLPSGEQHILIKYRAGYETIPDDVNAVARELVRVRYYERQTDPSITSITLGPYSATFSRGEGIVRDKLANYIDAGGFVA